MNRFLVALLSTALLSWAGAVDQGPFDCGSAPYGGLPAMVIPAGFTSDTSHVNLTQLREEPRPRGGPGRRACGPASSAR